MSSAWTHKLSAVDLQRNSVRWTVEVGREPRGLALQRDGRRAYLSHLTGAALTRVDDLGGSSPTVQRLELAASPLRAPAGKALNASLGYALTLSPDEGLLFAPRHAQPALALHRGLERLRARGQHHHPAGADQQRVAEADAHARERVAHRRGREAEAAGRPGHADLLQQRVERDQQREVGGRHRRRRYPIGIAGDTAQSPAFGQPAR